MAIPHLVRWSHTGADGLTLRGWHSEPSGKPLLHFLHGNGFCSLAYEPMLGVLAADFDLWLCDVQGHGDSDVGEQFLGWNENAELACAAFLAHQSLWAESVPRFAVGHSFGGVLTSLIMASHPALFSRAVLLDPVLFTPVMVWAVTWMRRMGFAKRSALARQATTRRRHWPDAAAALAQLTGRGIFKGWSEAALQAYVTHAMRVDEQGGVTLKCPAKIEATIFSSTPAGLWSALKTIHTPVRLIYGEETYPFVSESAQRWHRAKTTLELQKTAGGHCFMQEQPALAAQAVRDFLLPER